MLQAQTPDCTALIESWRLRVQQVLEHSLPAEKSEPLRLHQAMRYSALAGGKRIRPLLVYAASHALGKDLESLDALACSLELIHAYSLIHDDLPAMDDDDWRRGRATCHLAFDEATAILAGDALQALAFEQLAAMPTPEPAVTLSLMQLLAKACGSKGMAGGQMLDLNANGQDITLADLEHIHTLKTGALISLSVTGPAIFAQAPAEQIDALAVFGHCVGLGFQIVDDILDVTGESNKTGKPTQADAARSQPTFPALIGLEASQKRANGLLQQAQEAVLLVAGDSAPLLELAKYMIQRDH